MCTVVSAESTLVDMPPTVNMGIPGATASITEPVTGKRVLLAEPRGYCAGVDRAVETVERALEKHGAPVYVRHEIVHNRHVVETLAKAGAVFVEETDEVPEGAIVVFSAHGVAPTVHTTAAERRLKVIDATCPLVTKVHNEAKRFARDDYDILLIGHEGHEEVVGTAGEAPDHVQLVDGPSAVDGVTVRDENKVIWLSQTTLSVDETMETVQRLRARFPKLQDPPSDDICYATQNRQVAVKAMAPECELVIVVGSRWAPGRRPRIWSTTPRTSIPPGWTASPPSESRPARQCLRCWSAACWSGWPSTATTWFSR
jgi:4-hydroxy-3-methylbut-2-enyl diphosphate reductase